MLRKTISTILILSTLSATAVEMPLVFKDFFNKSPEFQEAYIQGIVETVLMEVREDDPTNFVRDFDCMHEWLEKDVPRKLEEYKTPRKSGYSAATIIHIWALNACIPKPSVKGY